MCISFTIVSVRYITRWKNLCRLYVFMQPWLIMYNYIWFCWLLNFPYHISYFLWIDNLLLRLVDENHFFYLQCNSLVVFVYVLVMMLQLDYRLRSHRCLCSQRLMCQIYMTKSLVGHRDHNSKTHYVSPCISWCSYIYNLYGTKCRMNHNIPLLFSRWPLYYKNHKDILVFWDLDLVQEHEFANNMAQRYNNTSKSGFNLFRSTCLMM